MENILTENNSGATSAPLIENGNEINGAQNYDALEDQSEFLEELAMIEALSPRQFDYYRVVTSLINEPNFTFSDPLDAGGEFRKRFGFTTVQWDRTSVMLKHKYKIFNLTKRDGLPNPHLSLAIKLNIDGLLNYTRDPKQPFVTTMLLTSLKEKLEADEGEFSDEERQSYISQIDEIIKLRFEQHSQSLGEWEKADAARLADIQQLYQANDVWKIRANERKSRKIFERNQNTELSTNEQAGEKPHQSKTKAKKVRQKPDKMIFDYIAAGQHIFKHYSSNEFKKLDPMTKLLHGIGNSATFAATYDHQSQYVIRLLNKGADKDSTIDETSYEALLSQAKKMELIHNGGPVFQLAKNAIYKIRSQKRAEQSDAENQILNLETEEDSIEQPTFTEEEIKELSHVGSAASTFIGDLITYKAIAEPEKCDWIYAPNNNLPIMTVLAAQLGVNEDTFSRQVNRMVNGGFIEIELTRNGQTYLSNIRFTEKGVAIWKEKQKRLIEQGKILDPTKVEEVDSMIDTCIELAEALGKNDIVENIKLERDKQHLSEMLRKDFKIKAKQIERLLIKLQKEYAEEFSVQKSIAA